MVLGLMNHVWLIYNNLYYYISNIVHFVRSHFIDKGKAFSLSNFTTV